MKYLISLLKKNVYIMQACLSIYYLFTDYIVNHIFSHIPFWHIRKLYFLLIGAKIGKGTRMDMNITFLDPGRINIGANSHINCQCLIDARGTLLIGNNVSISLRSAIVTGSHNYNSPKFDFVKTRIQIDNNVWIGFQSTIIGNVHIGEGAVVCAGAVVTKDIDPYTVVAGIPAKKIGTRNRDIDYIILEKEYYFPSFA